MIRKVIYFNILLSIAFASGQANAQRYDIVTKISKIRFHGTENVLATAWPGISWISAASAGDLINSSCGKAFNEYTFAISPADKDALAIALTAKGINADVLITLDDSVKLPGASTCMLQYITLY